MVEEITEFLKDKKELKAVIAEAKSSKEKPENSVQLINDDEIWTFEKLPDDPQRFKRTISFLGEKDLDKRQESLLPIRIWDSLIRVKKSQGFVVFDDILEDKINTTDVYNNVKELRDYAKKLKKDVTKDFEAKKKNVSVSSDEDFDKHLDTDELRKGKDVIRFIAKAAQGRDKDFNERDIENTFEDKQNKFFNAIKNKNVGMTDEQRTKYGQIFLKKIDEIITKVNESANKKKNTEEFVDLCVDSLKKLKSIYTYLIHVPLIHNDGKFVKSSDMQDYDTSTRLNSYKSKESKRAFVIGNCEILKKFINEYFLNPEISVNSVTLELGKKRLEGIASEVEEYTEDELDRIQASMDGSKTREVLEKAGIVFKEPSEKLKEFVKNRLHIGFVNIKSYKIWACVNPKTEQAYQNTLEKDGDNAHVKWYWHGTENQNLLSILVNGLLIRPHADHGRMFGDGIYFANNTDKSYGYTSGYYAKWNSGHSNKVFLLLFKVNLGKTYIATHSMDNVPKGYDSVTALAKKTELRMDEFIIYDTSRCTIKAMIEINISKSKD